MGICFQELIMGVGLYLNGQFPDSWADYDPEQDRLAKMAEWFEQEVECGTDWGGMKCGCQLSTDADGERVLFVTLHAVGEDVRISFPEPDRVLVSAKTSTVGPGYHTALCRLLRRFGAEWDIAWQPPGEEDTASQDDTGYFFSGDREAVEVEMLRQLQAMARITLENLSEHDYTSHRWNMPLGGSVSEYPGELHTPMGPRSREWIQAVLKNPHAGRDLYPWWDEGITARFYLGRAVHEMWNQMRWRLIVSVREYDAWNVIWSDLVRAYEADPALDYPWREWLELLEILQASDDEMVCSPELEATIRRQANRVPADKLRIGYRRFPVRVPLGGGWSIRLPGKMAEEDEENGWRAWDEERTVWIMCGTVGGEGDNLVPADELLQSMELSEGEPIPYPGASLLGKGVLRDVDNDGQTMRQLETFSATDGKICMCSFYFDDDSHLPWALETWQSLECSS